MTMRRSCKTRYHATLATAAFLGFASVLAACGDNLQTPQPAVVDAIASTVELTPTTARADGDEYVIVRVTVKDTAGQPLPGTSVEIAASGDGTTVSQPPLPTGVDGVALGSVSSSVAGSAEISVVVRTSAAEVELAQRPTATFTPVARRLEFLTPPTDGVAGATLAPALQVAIQDNVGNVMTDMTTSITIALQDNPGAGTLLGTTTVDAVAGVATFAGLSLEQAAAGYTLVATAHGLTDAVSDPFTIAPAAPVALAFAQQPVDVVAGVAIAPPVTVEVQDEFGNVATNATGSITVALGANPGAATLGGTVTRSVLDGAATFHDLTVDKLGSGYRLTATAADLPTATSDAFAVTAAPAVRLVLTGLPDPLTAGAATNLVVTARDSFGNVITDFADTVSFTSTDGQAVLPAAFTFQPADLGTHTFAGVALRTTGVRSITATAQTATAVTGTVTVLVAPAPATALEFTVQPANGRAGTALAPAVVVTLRDAYGNVAAESSNQVTLAIASGPAGASLSGEGPRPPVTGVVAFDYVTLDKAGAYTLRASAGSLTAAVSTSFTVAAGDPAALVFTVEPSTATAGVAVSPAVQVAILDALGNRVTAATDSVALAVVSGPASATLTGLGPLDAVAGVAAFPAVTGTTAGTYTLRATSGTLTAAVSVPFDVEPAASAQLSFLTAPTDAAAGAAVAPAIRVAVEDQFGNLVPTATPAVSLAIVTGPAGAALAGGGPVTAVAGVATLPAVSFTRAGTYTIHATAAGGLQSAPSTTFTISPAAIDRLVFVDQPTTATPGAVISPAVTVALQDMYGNTVPTATPSIGLTLQGGDPTAVLTGGDLTAPVNGIVTFAALSIDRPGSDYVLVAAFGGLTPATSALFSIFGAPHHVAFVVQPSSGPANGAFTVAAAVQDDSGATITIDDTTEITVAIGTNPGMGVLGGVTTQRVTRGVATFAGLTIDAPGTGYELEATAGLLLPATSAPFTIFGAPAKLLFALEPPASVAVDAPFAVRVTVADAGNNTIGDDNTTSIDLTLHGSPAGVTLGGATTATVVAGVADFANLTVDVSAPAYQLDATTGALPDATSGEFDVYTTPSAGDLLITEIMHITMGRDHQWFEIKNVSTKVIALDGLELMEGMSYVPAITTDALVRPKEYFVFGASDVPANNGGVTTVGYVYPGDFNLGNGSNGALSILHGSTLIDEVQWNSTDWPNNGGAAMNLSANAQGGDANDFSWWWCVATTPLTDGFGTPGAANVLCGAAASEPLDLCRLESPVDIAGVIEAGSSQLIAGRFGEAGVTDRATCNAFYPFVEGQLGFGVSTDASTWTSWVDATFDPTYIAGCAAGEDQMVGDVTFLYGGAQLFGYRFRLLDPDTGVPGDWAYCDRNGLTMATSSDYGTVTVQQCSPGSQVVISQVYGGGGNGGAPLLNDFVELHNRGLTDVDVSGWSIQYASATGTGNFGNGPTQLAAINGTIPAGGFYLVQLASGGATGAPLPTPDAVGTIALAGASGKVALVKQATGLGCNGGTTPCDAGQLALIADLVGYGTANFFETAAAPELSNTTAAIRIADGSARSSCVDTNDNSADFAELAPAPRNSAAPAVTCGCQGP